MVFNFLLIGHRGTLTDFDENTINAFTKSTEYGADYIEFDVRKTKDKHLIVFHDSTLDRTTNGKGLVKRLTYNEIRRFKTKIHQAPIPLLSEVLGIFRKKTNFMIEMKEENLIDDIIIMVKEYDVMDDLIFSGRYLKEIDIIKSKLPNINVCYNISKGFGLTLEEFIDYSRKETRHGFKFDMISLKSNLISQEFIESCHRFKIKPISWDFLTYKNPIKKIKTLIEWGIEGVLFDNYKNIPKIKDWLNFS